MMLFGSPFQFILLYTFYRCLDDGKNGNSLFLPRYESSAVVLYLQAFSSSLEKVSIWQHLHLGKTLKHLEMTCK